MACKIYTYPDNARVQRCKIAGAYAGVEIEEVNVQVPLEDGPLKAANPLARVPFMQTPDGEWLSESLALLYYVGGRGAGGDLLGRSHFEKSLVMKWLQITESDLHDSFGSLMLWKVFPNYFKFNPSEIANTEKKVQRVLTAMNEHLKDSTYLTGERLTVADIAVVCCLNKLFSTCIADSIRSQIPQVMRLFNTCAAKANFAKVLGEIKMCDKTLKEIHEEELKAKKEAAKAEKAERAAPTTTAAAAPAPAETEAPAKKPKHPNESLPETPMVLDEWKRQYSNTDTLTAAIPWLWENLDKEGYTFWFCKYKYNEELNKTFMAANLITGWFQRVEGIRKYLFGNVHVFGKSGEGVEISGVWLIRGSLEPTNEVMMGSDDAAYFDWRKMNIDDATDKQLVVDYFAWEGKFAGGSELEFNQGKTFK